MINGRRKVLEICIFLLILAWIGVNWEKISWAFNYQEVAALSDNFFKPYPESSFLMAAESKPVINDISLKYPPISDNSQKYPYVDKDNSLEIGAIGINVPVITGESTNVDVLEGDLSKGVVYYPGSVYPGEKGQILILGHSAPPNWPHIKYDWAFSDLSKLNMGDQIIFYFNNRKYVYSVSDKQIIAKGEDVALSASDQQSNVLTIVSCWPPGKNYKRIAIVAKLIN